MTAVEGRLEVPESQDYLKRELDNVISALADIDREVQHRGASAQARDLLVQNMCD